MKYLESTTQILIKTKLVATYTKIIREDFLDVTTVEIFTKE